MGASRVLRRSTVFAAAVLGATGLARAASPGAPGAPGKKAIWTPADKDGFGTSKTTASKVWYTLTTGS